MKSALIHKLSMSYTRLVMFVLMLSGIAVVNTAMAVEASDVPKITGFYPMKVDNDPVEFKITNKAYIHYEHGSNILRNKVRIMQDGEEIGQLVYAQGYGAGASPTVSTVMDPASALNADLAKIKPGLFTLEIYEIAYISNGEEYLYSDVNNPIETVTYKCAQPNGKVIEETGMTNKEIRSYYPLDGTEGVKTFRFDKQVVPDHIYARFEYGMGNTYVNTALEHKLSDDGHTLTIDLRGKCYSSDVLAPGVTFYDDSGNPVPPPTVVSLVIDGLYCTDGTCIEYMYVSLDGNFSLLRTAEIFQNYNYRDLTFTTPIITHAEFYNSENPETRYNIITPDTDMLDLSVIFSEYIKSADMLFTSGSTKATVEYKDINCSGSTYTVSLPAEIKALGSDNLIISLENVEYTDFDGTDHVIKPYNVSGVTKDILSVAELRELPEGTEAVLNVSEGLTVTLSNDMGYTFVEDSTAGLQIATEDYSKVLNEGTMVAGKLYGVYEGDGLFVINPSKSSYTETPADVSVGTMVDRISDLVIGKYDNRLVTVVASANVKIAYDAQTECIMIDDMLPVMVDFADGLVIPSEITDVTGIMYANTAMGQPMLIIRSEKDINQNIGSIVEINSLGELSDLNYGDVVMVNLHAAKVTYTNSEYGMSIIEDETGAAFISQDDFEAFSSQGHAVTGHIVGEYLGDHNLYITAELTEIEETPTDVTTGQLMTLAQACDPRNCYRLVTFNNTKDTPIVSEGFGLYIGDVIAGVDMYDVLNWDYTMPDSIKSFTGIIQPVQMIDIDEFDEQPQMTLVAFRGEYDIVAATDGITSVGADQNVKGDVYDLRGIKHNDTKSIRGIYIVDGKKVYIK